MIYDALQEWNIRSSRAYAIIFLKVLMSGYVNLDDYILT